MLLDRAGLRHAFELLDAELGRMGVRADVFVVGGAAMAMAYDARRATRDVDAVFVPSAEVRLAAQRIATELGLDPGWLNDGAKAYVPGDDPSAVQVYEGQHLQVAAASPRLLLAMKLLAARVERDTDDIVALYALCGFTTADDGLRLVTEAYPSYVIAPRTRFLLEELYPPHRAPTVEQDRDTGLGL
ncbi:MAG TPA: DUF6036 family nucleotidyltransferase [Acidimicrobiales bacterium]|nr:DUF6036 family nucleotidyltransferase [Acidimicrobiales bacterium]